MSAIERVTSVQRCVQIGTSKRPFYGLCWLVFLGLGKGTWFCERTWWFFIGLIGFYMVLIVIFLVFSGDFLFFALLKGLQRGRFFFFLFFLGFWKANPSIVPLRFQVFCHESFMLFGELVRDSFVCFSNVLKRMFSYVFVFLKKLFGGLLNTAWENEFAPVLLLWSFFLSYS